MSKGSEVRKADHQIQFFIARRSLHAMLDPITSAHAKNSKFRTNSKLKRWLRSANRDRNSVGAIVWTFGACNFSDNDSQPRHHRVRALNSTNQHWDRQKRHEVFQLLRPERGVQVELWGATAKAHGWGNVDLIPGIKINTDAMARTTQLVQEGFVKISES
jgi:hypothetical protein